MSATAEHMDSPMKMIKCKRLKWKCSDLKLLDAFDSFEMGPLVWIQYFLYETLRLKKKKTFEGFYSVSFILMELTMSFNG